MRYIIDVLLTYLLLSASPFEPPFEPPTSKILPWNQSWSGLSGVVELNGYWNILLSNKVINYPDHTAISRSTRPLHDQYPIASWALGFSIATRVSNIFDRCRATTQKFRTTHYSERARPDPDHAIGLDRVELMGMMNSREKHGENEKWTQVWAGALKMLDVKMTDQMTGHENAGHEFAHFIVMLSLLKLCSPAGACRPVVICCPSFSCPAISCLAISCPAISRRANWSVIFMYVIFSQPVWATARVPGDTSPKVLIGDTNCIVSQHRVTIPLRYVQLFPTFDLLFRSKFAFAALKCAVGLYL